MGADGPTEQPRNRWLDTAHASAEEYDARYEQRAEAGENVHGEADFVMRFKPGAVLDAGCGTGRVARELARRGVDVVGVDIDEDMLATARRKAPDLTWRCADLASVDLGRAFDVILLAGNVMIFLAPGTEPQVLANLARQLAPGGLIVAAFQLQPGRLTVGGYDAIAAAAGLRLKERWSTWERGAWDSHGDYVLSVHAPAREATA
jgi:SAM-dependent methyltransferase